MYEETSSDVTGFPFEMGTYSGRVYIERLLNDVTYFPFEVGVCSAHVYGEASQWRD